MTKIKIKICGLSGPEDIAAVNELLPDYIGFVFWPHSKRRVTKDSAASLKAMLDKRIKAVGVFVNAPAEEVADLANSGIIDVAQLHGDEDDEYISELRALTNCEIIKAFKIRSSADVRKAERSTADLVLLDAGYGEGKPFEWRLVKNNISRPYLLAGGLTADTLSEAVTALHPYGVDVSSAVETVGKKDFDKMKKFITIAKTI